MAKTNKGRKFFATTATAALVASAIVPVASAAQVNDFNSIASYAQEAVQDLVDRGVVQGDANGNFQPRKSVSRAEAATILTGALGLTTSEQVNFTDVKSGAWYYDAINAAVNNGVFSGKGAGIFEPNGNLTRGEAAIILVNAFNLDGRASLAQFSDEKSVKAWAVESLEIAVGNGVIKGDNGKIKANDAITKQDFAVMFSRAEAAADAVAAHSVKVINATTVEVTFPEAVSDAAKLNIAIDGLTISNKAVKQSDSKTVVLTTSAQEAGKEYTVTVDGDAVGKFTGVAQVIPTAVKIVEQSLQAKVGTQVTLKAQVTVAEGQSKANIPVTFNIVNNAEIGTATLNQPIVVEALTDENGVATHTYTRYAQTSLQIASHDEVQAYATGNPTARSFSKVYWSSIQPLAIAEVTEGNSIQNGGKKVYRVTAALGHTETVTAAAYAANSAYYQAKGIYGAGNYVNIGFQENTNVTPDKAIKSVDVIDATGRNLGYPGQYTTSVAGSNNLNNWVKEVKIKLDANGQAIFTLSGIAEKAEAVTVTPYVFVDQKVNPENDKGTSGRFEATELNAYAPAVSFVKQHTLKTTIEALKNQYAASFFNGALDVNGKDLGVQDGNYIADTLEAAFPGLATKGNLVSYTTLPSDLGGRDYKLTITDQNGKLAPKGTKVGVKLDFGTSQRQLGGAIYYVDATNKLAKKVTGDASVDKTDTIWTSTDAYGNVNFTLIGYKDTYVTPTVVIDSGNTKDVVDVNDQQIKGEIVYFSDARVADAVLTSSKKTATANNIDEIEFTYQTVDQNGKAYRPHLTGAAVNNPDLNNVPVTFELTTTFNPIEVKVGTSEPTLPNFLNLGANVVQVGPDSNGNYLNNPYNYRSLTVVANDKGVASVKVKAFNGTDVKVVASTSIAGLPQLLTESVSFVSSTQVIAPHTGLVSSITGSTLTFVGKDAITYNQANAKYQTLGGAVLTKESFQQIAALGNVVVQYTIVDNAPVFTVVSVGGVNITSPADANLTQALAKAEGVDRAKYTVASLANLDAAVAAAKALTVTATDAQKQAAATAITAAITALAPVTPVEQTIEGVVITNADGLAPSQTAGLLGLFTGYEVAGTVANDAITSVTLTYTFDNASATPVTKTVNVTNGTFSDTLAAQEYSVKSVTVSSSQATGTLTKNIATKVSN